MKKLLGLLVTIAMCLFAVDASAQSYIPTTTGSACIANGAGDIITSGTLVIVGTDQNDNPIPYRVNGTAQATTAPISRTITNGQLATALQLANPALTSPLNVLYRITILDNVTKRSTVYKQVIVAANNGSNFDLCVMNTGPSFAPVTVVTNPGTVNGNTVQNGDFTVNGRFVSTMQTVTFSATPIFDCSLTAGGSFFKITLTANVTSSTLSNCSTGQRIVLEICQDATGSRTFVAPTNIQGFVTIPSTLSTCTAQFFIFDGGISKAVPDSTSALAVNGVSYPAAPSTHSVPVVTAANTITYKVVPDCQDVTGNHLNYTQSTDTFSCGVSVPATVVTLTGTQTLTNKNLQGAASGNAVTLLNKQDPTGTLTGNAADQVVYTYTLPANTMQAGKGIRITTYVNHTTGSAVITYKVNFGGAVYNTAVSTDTAVAAERYSITLFNNAGVTNAQSGVAEVFSGGAYGIGSLSTSAIDTTAAVVITLTFNAANTQQVQGRLWMVELIQ